MEWKPRLLILDAESNPKIANAYLSFMIPCDRWLWISNHFTVQLHSGAFSVGK